jgi:hypothetical protein
MPPNSKPIPFAWNTNEENLTFSAKPPGGVMPHSSEETPASDAEHRPTPGQDEIALPANAHPLPSAQAAAEHVDVPDLLAEVHNLTIRVERVSAWMEGSMSMLRIMGIAITVLAAFGVFQLVNSAIDSSV